MNTFAPDGSTDPTVIAGYKAIHDTTVNKILTSPVGQIELLFANNADGAIRITAALQHPFSQGRIYITSSNPMDYPIIDPNYLNHPAGTLFPCRLLHTLETKCHLQIWRSCAKVSSSLVA